MKTNQTLTKLTLALSIGVVGITLYANNVDSNVTSTPNNKMGVDSNRSIKLNKCFGCHGKSFEKSALGKSAIVKDLNSTQIYDALIGYKNNQGGPLKMVMKTQIKDYSEGDLNIIANQISKSDKK